MTVLPLPDIIVIDDDPINNMICVKMLRHLMPGVQISAFTDPMAGIAHIASSYTTDNCSPVLFLDIDMPSLTGWQVLQKITLLPAELRQQLKVFILTSSADPVDRRNAENDPLVASFVTKPLSHEKLKEIFPQYVQ